MTVEVVNPTGIFAGNCAAGASPAEARVRAEQRRFWRKDQSGRRPASHPVVRAMYAKRAAFIAGLVEDAVESSVLDVGCGTGAMLPHLRRYFGRVVAVDFSPSMLDKLEACDRVCGDASCLPLRSGSFDVVTASQVLHHVPERERAAAVREFARVARRCVVLYEPNRNNPAMFCFGLLKKTERMSLAFSRKYLARLAECAGLSVVHCRAEGTILPNRTPTALLWIARMFDRRPFNCVGFYVAVAGVPNRREGLAAGPGLAKSEAVTALIVSQNPLALPSLQVGERGYRMGSLASEG